ncbi:signal peptide peptidase SppA [Gellertiella hungarica]|uniref:Protease-4 n=1 Tax=Gellertiella hungarica TaxID=1572859 RepID=A0A7W6NJJ3_9HYPH|nr:signal peptide peptidase SppA [Gellertiella hungarica]MBB4063788.1 protease-4 [Gellertiella hungarica]
MDAMMLADRRRLRRKVTFWRVVAVLLVAAIGFSLFRFAGSEMDYARPHIARITIEGIIQDDTELLERLKTIEESDAAKGLVVSISSPGGTTYGGERLFKAIRAVAAKKPVVSDVRTLAASAGYMVATAGDVIVAGETSITGSIGVIFEYPQAKPLLDKIGVSLEEIKSSPLKAEPSPFHTPPEEAKTMIRSMVADSYDWFVNLVAERRKLPKEEALRLADGRILTGRQALKEKLVDKLGGDREILDYFKSRGVSGDLEIEEWKATSDSGLFGMQGLARAVLGALGVDAAAMPADLAGFLRGKLFLDGLVSVWQVD